jgi:hypothetical protein
MLQRWMQEYGVRNLVEALALACRATADELRRVAAQIPQRQAEFESRAELLDSTTPIVQECRDQIAFHGPACKQVWDESLKVNLRIFMSCEMCSYAVRDIVEALAMACRATADELRERKGRRAASWDSTTRILLECRDAIAFHEGPAHPRMKPAVESVLWGIFKDDAADYTAEQAVELCWGQEEAEEALAMWYDPEDDMVHVHVCEPEERRGG